MAKKDDLDALTESLEIIANPETMKMLKLSAKNKAKGKVFEANYVKDLLKQNV
ncbi:MAG: hypothetical protein Q7J54_05430 [Candidatus Woesearchaeota archaeon]|nr:hypothetical protein [Candidatus Woesearchaeota archaeon]